MRSALQIARRAENWLETVNRETGERRYRASCGTHSIEPEPLGEQDPNECRAPATLARPPAERATVAER